MVPKFKLWPNIICNFFAFLMESCPKMYTITIWNKIFEHFQCCIEFMVVKTTSSNENKPFGVLMRLLLSLLFQKKRKKIIEKYVNIMEIWWKQNKRKSCIAYVAQLSIYGSTTITKKNFERICMCEFWLKPSLRLCILTFFQTFEMAFDTLDQFHMKANTRKGRMQRNVNEICAARYWRTISKWSCCDNAATILYTHTMVSFASIHESNFKLGMKWPDHFAEQILVGSFFLRLNGR